MLKYTCSWGEHGLSFQKMLKNKLGFSSTTSYRQWIQSVWSHSSFLLCIFVGLIIRTANSELLHDCWNLNILLFLLLDCRAASVPDDNVVKVVCLLKCNGHGKYKFWEKNHNFPVWRSAHSLFICRNLLYKNLWLSNATP